MPLQDNIPEMIDSVGRSLLDLRSVLSNGKLDPAEADRLVVEAADKAGIDLHFLCSVHEETLIIFVTPEDAVDPARCWLTAELFYVDGLRCRIGGDEAGATTRFEKALILYRLLPRDTVVAVGFPEVGERLQEVEGLLP